MARQTMSATLQRDQASNLAKHDPRKAMEMAFKISDPWFRSQALSWVARYTEDDPVKVANHAANAARECDDAYKQTAVRAWEIAALAERKYEAQAKRGLREAVSQSKNISPNSTRADALMLLLQAAFQISIEEAKWVAEELEISCGRDSHWRCKRAIREAGRLLDGERKPRPFFW